MARIEASVRAAMPQIERVLLHVEARASTHDRYTIPLADLPCQGVLKNWQQSTFATAACEQSADEVPFEVKMIRCSLYDKAWSPYVAGVVIGLLQAPAFLIIETALGASSSYVTVGGILASFVDPAVTKIDYVARHIAATGKNWWQVALVAGIAIGAFISMKLSGARRQRISPVWRRALRTSSPPARYAIAFGGGFVMLFGARIADGCTSGHGLSGMAQLAVSSTIAVTAMFAGGIVTALLLLRRI